MGYLVDGNLTGKDMLHPLGTAYEYSDGILPEAVDGEPTAVFLRSVTRWGGRVRALVHPRHLHGHSGVGPYRPSSVYSSKCRGGSAPGHNAESVADWVVVALSFLASHSADSAPKRVSELSGWGMRERLPGGRGPWGCFPYCATPAGDSGQRLSVRVV